MSKADAVARTGKSRSAIVISMLILLSAFVGLSTLPTATAVVTGDLALSEEISPIADRNYTSYASLELAVKIENLDNGISPPRILDWYVCEGGNSVSQCISNPDDDGQDTIPAIAAGEVRNHIISGGGFVKWGADGSHTIIYRFSEADSQGGNDQLIYNFNLTTRFVDFNLDVQNPIDGIPHLAQDGDDKVLNTNTDYNITITFDFNSCGTCSVDATIGWELYSADGLTLISQANHTIAMASTVGLEKQLSNQIPIFSYSTEGRYIMKFGLLDSSGSTDMVSSNNLDSVDIVLDDAST